MTTLLGQLRCLWNRGYELTSFEFLSFQNQTLFCNLASLQSVADTPSPAKSDRFAAQLNRASAVVPRNFENMETDWRGVPEWSIPAGKENSWEFLPETAVRHMALVDSFTAGELRSEFEFDEEGSGTADWWEESPREIREEETKEVFTVLPNEDSRGKPTSPPPLPPSRESRPRPSVSTQIVIPANCITDSPYDRPCPSIPPITIDTPPQLLRYGWSDEDSSDSEEDEFAVLQDMSDDSIDATKVSQERREVVDALFNPTLPSKSNEMKEEQEEEWIEESPRDEFVAPPTFVDSSLLSKTTMQRRLVHGDENMETKRHIMLQCFNDGMTMCLQVLPQKQEHIPERNVRESEVIEEEELPCDDDPREEDEIMYMGEGKE